MKKIILNIFNNTITHQQFYQPHRTLMFSNLVKHQKFNFARYTGRKIKEVEINENIKENQQLKKEEQQIFSNESKEANTTTNKVIHKEDSRQTSEEAIYLDISQLEKMVTSLYKKSKLNLLDANKKPLNEHARHFGYYNFILQNYKKLTHEYQAKFIKALCFFKYKDDKINDILSFHLHGSKNKLTQASLVLYALSSLRMSNEHLLNQAVHILETEDFSKEEKSTLLPMLYSLSELGTNNETINQKVDEFVTVNQASFTEHVNII
jgi:hypothetical protein